jgi:hypothetical protein
VIGVGFNCAREPSNATNCIRFSQLPISKASTFAFTLSLSALCHVETHYTEVTLGATGRRAGFAKKDRGSPKSASRLCRASLARRFVQVRERLRIAHGGRGVGLGGGSAGPDGGEGGRGGGGGDTIESDVHAAGESAFLSPSTSFSPSFSYANLKEAAAGYRGMHLALLTPPSPLAAWVRKDPVSSAFRVSPR